MMANLKVPQADSEKSGIVGNPLDKQSRVESFDSCIGSDAKSGSEESARVGAKKLNKRGASVPELIPDWLNLASMDLRLKAMPAAVAQAVLESNQGGWQRYRGKSGTKEIALQSLHGALEAGKVMPESVVKTMLASMRSFDGKEDNAVDLERLLCVHPHYAVFLYSLYGLDAINERVKRRKEAKGSQSEWTLGREQRAAERCRVVWGGVPPLGELSAHTQAADDPDLYGLRSKLVSRKAIEAFAKKHGLERITRRGADGTWSTPEGQAELRESYRQICLKFNRYVCDHELSQRVRITLDGKNGADSETVACNSLRANIRDSLNLTVKKLFLDLCDKEELPKSWKKQVRTPTTNAGQSLDSYSEVWWLEAALKAQAQLPDGHPLKSVFIYNHPYIGESDRKSDFLVGSVYVEVLRHSLYKIQSPTTDDEASYAVKLKERVEEYKRYGLRYVTMEPHEFTDPEKISTHFDKLFALAGNMPETGIKVRVSAEKYPGYWFQEQHRDSAILEVIQKSEGAPGRYPAFRVISEHFGGLAAYLHQQGPSWDRQVEALRVQTLCIASGANRPRLPTEAELLQVCRAHLSSVLDASDKITRQSLERTFGRGAMAFLRRVRQDICEYLTMNIANPAGSLGCSSERQVFE